MTKRLSAGILLGAVAVMLFTLAASAERPGERPFVGSARDNAMLNPTMPLFFRAVGGTTWVQVHPIGTSPCAPEDTANSPNGQTVDHVWCFEGSNGDSTWPAVPVAQNTGSKHETWDHWSLFDPAHSSGSRWHITTRHGGTQTGTYNAWCGCDSLGTNPACSDVAFWVNQEGYGDDWNFSLIMDASGQDCTTGGTVEFDIRYDCECNYDYAYLEYFDEGTGDWELLVADTTTGDLAVFNTVSGNDGAQAGRDCGDDFFGCSDQFNVPPVITYHGNETWYTNVVFPLPAKNDGLQLRWRGFSDGAWSDADGQGDTDGIVAIDNVLVTFNNTGNEVSDDFESGDFNGIATTGILPAASWIVGTLEGELYDGWHLQFDPRYSNKGNTCTYSSDWMWAAKPASGAIPVNQFNFLLVSPVIDTNGWTGGVSEYSGYMCMLDDLDDYTNQQVRTYDSANGWGLWQDFDGFITFAGCEFWNFNDGDELTAYLGAEIDSMQLAWSVLDVDQDGDFAWGRHGAVQYLIDNVSIGSFDGENTIFTARNIDIFADTFSQSDPSHTPFLSNAEQGMWIGLSAAYGTRLFANQDSITVAIADYNGVTEANVDMYWRHDRDGSWSAWDGIQMDLALADPTSASDEGTYRGIIGNDLGGTQDLTIGGDNLIWTPGVTVQYYIKVVDDAMNEATFPDGASESPATYFEFSVLPFGKETDAGEKILLVDDYTRNSLDFENSDGFDPTGGAGYGNFTDPVFDQPEDLVELALANIFGGSEADPKWDKYDVQGGGTSQQCEPRGLSDIARGLGGYMDDFGVIQYDALIWLQGTFGDYSFADTTRMELMTYLDAGGNLFASGDDIAWYLGTGGADADSTLGFIIDYLGTSFTSSVDDVTDHRVLNVVGQAGTSMDGMTFGLYGECPGIRRDFDRMLLSVPSGATNSVLLRYGASTAGDNNRVAMVKNVRTASGGCAVLAGFGVEAMLYTSSRTCLLYGVLTTDFGLTAPAINEVCMDGVDAPVIASSGFGFSLANAAPNPFDANTSIKFSVASRQHVSIEVYNILGQKVRTLTDETMEPGSYTAMWDGRSDAGVQVSSGIYFYKMVAGDFSDTKKAVLLK